MGGFRRFRMVTIPVTVAAFGVVALLAQGGGDRAEELVGLPGRNRHVPDQLPETPTTTVTDTSATASTATSAVAASDVVPEVEPVRRAPVSERPPPPTTGPGERRDTTTTAVPVATAAGGGVHPDPAVVPPSSAPAPGAASDESRRTVSVPATTGTEPPTTTSTTAPATGSPSTTSTTAPADAVFEHTYPSEHQGPVWIKVDAPDDASRVVRIRWGPYQRLIVHETDRQMTYSFRKDPGPTVPTTVTVTRGAGVSVTFGHGLLASLGSVDVNDGWTMASDA